MYMCDKMKSVHWFFFFLVWTPGCFIFLAAANRMKLYLTTELDFKRENMKKIYGMWPKTWVLLPPFSLQVSLYDLSQTASYSSLKQGELPFAKIQVDVYKLKKQSELRKFTCKQVFCRGCNSPVAGTSSWASCAGQESWSLPWSLGVCI